MRVRDYLALPEHAAADDFIVRPQSTPEELARSYTLTSAIRPRLSDLLRDVAGALERNQDLGRFIFGSFGSGKSHFLRVAGMMLANDARLYDNARDDGLRALRNAHPFLETAKLLVVETSMVGVDENVAAFTRHLAASFDRTLVGLGKPPLRAFGTQAVFDEFDRLCRVVPETFDRFAAKTGYDQPFYEEQRAKGRAGGDVSAFARHVALFFAGDERKFLPTEAEAREQMAAHANELGYRGVVFAIDEFILWAQGLSGGGYVGAVNALNALVESADVKPVRFIVLAAIQRSIMSVFPDDASEKVLREQLARVKDRFPDLYLEDNNLFEIAEKRVLTPRPELADAWHRESERVTRDLTQSGRSVLVGDEPAATLTQLYPFHPALLRVLSDVSQGLHRARSSLFMLYQLLTTVRPELQMGELISLGSLWDVLFSADHLQNLESVAPKHDPNHRANLLLKTYGTWDRLRASIASAGGDEPNTTMLDLVVKSALLAQLSHTGFLDNSLRGLDRAVTIENLLRLNRADIPAMNERSGFMKIEDLLRKLATNEPGSVMLDGSGPSTIVRIELNAIDLSELLAALRPPSPFSTLLAEVKGALGFGAGFTSGQEGKLTTTLRQSERGGRVRFESIGQFSTSGKESALALESSDEFKLAILIENEFNGNAQQTIDNVRASIESARDQSQSWSAAWMPGPLSTEGREALDRLAKAQLFGEREDDYLGRFRAIEHGIVRQKIGAMKMQAQATLRTALQRAYGEGGRVITMRREPQELFAPANSDIADRAKLYMTQLLERRYPQHPKFGAAPSPKQLTALLTLDRRLSNEPHNNVLAGEELEVARKLGEPLELLEPGTGAANIKNGGLYLERLRESIAGGERNVMRLLSLLASEPIGLQRSPAQLLLAILAHRDGYRLVVDDHSLRINAINDVDPRATLQRGSLPALNVWNNARKAASLIFDIGDVPAAHNLGSSDALIAMLREPLVSSRELLRRCTTAFDRLATSLELGARCVVSERYAAAARQLAALDDATKVLERLAGLDIEPYVQTLQAAAVDAPALERLVAYDNLATVVATSPALQSSLIASLTADLPAVAPEIDRWLANARAFVTTSLQQASARAPETVRGQSAPITHDENGRVASTAAFGLSQTYALPLANDDVERLVAAVRQALQQQGDSTGSLSIEIRHISVHEPRA